MKCFQIGVAIAFCLIEVLIHASSAQATRRIVFDPHSGYCQSLIHVRNTKHCRERGGRW